MIFLSKHLLLTKLPLLFHTATSSVLKAAFFPARQTIRFCLKGNTHRASAAKLAFPLPLKYIVTLGNGSGTDFQSAPRHHRPAWPLPLPLMLTLGVGRYLDIVYIESLSDNEPLVSSFLTNLLTSTICNS